MVLVVIGLVFGALSGYGLGFLGLFGRIVCGGLLVIHALYLLLAVLICFLDRTGDADSRRLGAGGLTEYLAITLGFDTTLILTGRWSGVSAIDWRWVGAAAGVTLICGLLVGMRYVDGWRRHFSRG